MQRMMIVFNGSSIEKKRRKYSEKQQLTEKDSLLSVEINRSCILYTLKPLRIIQTKKFDKNTLISIMNPFFYTNERVSTTKKTASVVILRTITFLRDFNPFVYTVYCCRCHIYPVMSIKQPNLNLNRIGLGQKTHI